MKDKTVKEKINAELKPLTFTEEMKKAVLNSVGRRRKHFRARYALTAVLLIIFAGTTVFAGYHWLNRVNVNETVLPKLDEMSITKLPKLSAEADEYGIVREEFCDYAAAREEWDISLLDSALSADNPYMQGEIRTDRKDYAMIRVKNYIIGDTKNYVCLEDENRYQYERGEVYASPISLEIDLILSDEQLANGWDQDYLGMYGFAESYRSAQGWQVNLIQDTGGAGTEDYVSEKCAVFVADGVRYTLKGRVSIETMKKIVDSMTAE